MVFPFVFLKALPTRCWPLRGFEFPEVKHSVSGSNDGLAFLSMTCRRFHERCSCCLFRIGPTYLSPFTFDSSGRTCVLSHFVFFLHADMRKNFSTSIGSRRLTLASRQHSNGASTPSGNLSLGARYALFVTVHAHQNFACVCPDVHCGPGGSEGFEKGVQKEGERQPEAGAIRAQQGSQSCLGKTRVLLHHTDTHRQPIIINLLVYEDAVHGTAACLRSLSSSDLPAWTRRPFNTLISGGARRLMNPNAHQQGLKKVGRLPSDVAAHNVAARIVQMNDARRENHRIALATLPAGIIYGEEVMAWSFVPPP